MKLTPLGSLLEIVMRFGLLAGSVIFCVAVPGIASETVTYGYDAQGRLIDAAHTGGGATAGLDIQYQYDLAGNRSSQKVTGSANKGQQVIVLPINGFTIVPINP